MVIPAGVEPAIFWMRTRRPRPLDDGTDVLKLTLLRRKSKRAANRNQKYDLYNKYRLVG